MCFAPRMRNFQRGGSDGNVTSLFADAPRNDVVADFLRMRGSNPENGEQQQKGVPKTHSAIILDWSDGLAQDRALSLAPPAPNALR